MPADAVSRNLLPINMLCIVHEYACVLFKWLFGPVFWSILGPFFGPKMLLNCDPGGSVKKDMGAQPQGYDGGIVERHHLLVNKNIFIICNRKQGSDLIELRLTEGEWRI